MGIRPTFSVGSERGQIAKTKGRGRPGGCLLGGNSVSVQRDNDWYLETYNERNDEGFDLRNDSRNKFLSNARSNDGNS